MKKIYLIIGLLGILMACTPPLKKIYNEKTLIEDMNEIKNSIESSDFILLENEINNHHTEKDRRFKNKTYFQILDSIKNEIQNEEAIQLERQKLALEQPLQLLQATELGFEEFSFYFGGYEYKTVGYKLKGELINISDKAFINVEFEDKDDSFWANAKSNPYVEINLNNAFRLACVDFGSRFDNWEKIESIVLPNVSYENPWKSQEIKSFEMYFQPDVTCGFYFGVDDYGERIQPIHFNYEPSSCLLNIPIYLEDANGYKKQMFLTFDIMDDYENFKKRVQNDEL